VTFSPRVAEIGDGHAVRFCGYLFAQLGASVTRQRGDAPVTRHAQAAAVFLDRGKTLLDATPDLAQADVLLTDEEVDTTAFPELVVVRTCLFGNRGGYAGLTGTEAEAFALSGLMSMIGERGHEPLRIGGSQPEFATGLSMFSAAMMGLFRRDGSGQGASASVSVVRTGAYLDWKSQIYYAAEGKILQRGSQSGPVILTCADGFVGFYYRDEEWSAVRKLMADARLESERFSTQVLRDRNREDLVSIMNEWSGRLTRDEVYERSQALHIPAGSVLDLDELAESPQVRARRFITRQDVQALRTVSYPVAPWTVDGVRGGR
jgi:crotonobetainyl-CoA:carnitine CoA-transferase CaiB-like acyl-CoA transferase